MAHPRGINNGGDITGGWLTGGIVAQCGSFLMAPDIFLSPHQEALLKITASGIPRGFLDGSYYLLVGSGWLLLLYGDILGASRWLL